MIYLIKKKKQKKNLLMDFNVTPSGEEKLIITFFFFQTKKHTHVYTYFCTKKFSKRYFFHF